VKISKDAARSVSSSTTAGNVASFSCWPLPAAVLIRYGILSVFTVIFGPQIVTETASLFRQHPLLLMVLLVAVIVASLVVFWLLRAPAADIAAEWKNQENPDTKKDADRE